MKKKQYKENARYDLSRRVKSPRKKDPPEDYDASGCDSHACTMYGTVERNGIKKRTLAGFYWNVLPEFQKERKWAAKTCKAYNKVVRELIAPACAEYALEEMDEIDFFECWKRIQETSKSKWKIQAAYSLFRMIVDFAYRHNATVVNLWGLALHEPAQENDRKEQRICNADKEMGRQYVERGVRISCSIPLKTEMKLFLNLVQQVPRFGQALAGLILFSTGARTSETVAFQYRHLTEVTPGYWALQRINTSNPNARDSEIGGKTHNAFRLLWIPTFLAKLILDRREELLKIYPEKTVRMLHIACRGVDYQTPCTQKELNAYMKGVFEKVGVAEELIASAFHVIVDSKDAQQEYERSVVAYLGRHQAITAMVYCGLTEAQICACAGHEQVDADTQEYDFVNPDSFRKLATALSRRPVFQILDQTEEARRIIYDGNARSDSSDSGLQLLFDTDHETEFLLIAHSMGKYGSLKIKSTNNIQILEKRYFTFPGQGDRAPLSIRYHLYTSGMTAYDAVRHSSKSSELTSRCAADDSTWIERAADMDICVCQGVQEEIPPLSDATSLLADLNCAIFSRALAEARIPSAVPVLALPAGPTPILALPSGPVPALMLPSASVSETASIPLHSPAAEPPCSGDRPAPVPVLTGGVTETVLKGAANAPLVTISAQTILLDQAQGLTVLLSGKYPLSHRNVRGEQLIKEKKMAALYAYQPDTRVYLLSRTGRFYSGMAGCLTATATNACKDVLRDRGILLQESVFTQSGSFLLCLTTAGRIICVETKRLSRRIPADGVELVNVRAMQAQQTECVSACICPAGCDVLLITERGRALRVANSALHACKSLSLVPILGIELEPGDRAIACVPVTSDGVFTVTANGYGFLCREKIHTILPHGRNTQGVAFMKLENHDHIVSAFIPGQVVGTLREDGIFKLLNVDDFPDHGRNSGGVIAAKTKDHKRIVAAVTYKEVTYRE